MDFVFDPDGVGGRSVFVHLVSDTLTSRLTSARHPGGGDGRFLVLEDESDAASEPYKAFTAVRIVL